MAKCNKPCKECPFRKTSAKAWLGELSGQPEEFLDYMEHNILPCHMNTMSGGEMLVPGRKNPCIGALQFCTNSAKLPRGARTKGTIYYNLIDAAKPNDELFKWRSEFVAHHSIPGDE